MLKSRTPITLNKMSFDPMDWLRHNFTQLGTLAANPVAFFIVCAYGVLWFLF